MIKNNIECTFTYWVFFHRDTKTSCDEIPAMDMTPFLTSTKRNVKTMLSDLIRELEELDHAHENV